MPTTTVFQQLRYAYIGSAFIFFDDCKFDWTSGTTQQRELDKKHVNNLADNFAVQEIHQVAPEFHISVTIPQAMLEAYMTPERRAAGIGLRTTPPPHDATVDYFSAMHGFSEATKTYFEVQAGMHRLHAVKEFARRKELEEPPVIIRQGFVADICMYSVDKVAGSGTAPLQHTPGHKGRQRRNKMVADGFSVGIACTRQRGGSGGLQTMRSL